jgi:(1->4)-alpha-D-glucan 1-alpha-D-glucosylmutase
MEKAVREAKQHTSWTQQNKEFEDALKAFIERIFDSKEFVADLESFVALVLRPGQINSLAQTLIKYTAPGIPDTYQGSELWDLRLVDPDNRGPVDYDLRRTMLEELRSGITVDEILKRMDSGMPKLWVIYKALHLRRDRPEWFDESAAYTPLPTDGYKKLNLIAYLRGESVAVIAPRWNLRVGGNLGTTTVEIPSGRWSNLFTGDAVNGGKLRAQNLLQRFPVALLAREPE